MTNRNIEDIDKLFREGLNPEQDHLTFPEGEWIKMEQRLDRYDRRKRGIVWLTRFGSVAALIFLFFVLGILIRDGRQPINQQAEVQRKDQQPTANKNNEQQPAMELNEEQQTEILKEGQQPPTTSSEKEKTAMETPQGSGSGIVRNRGLAETPAASRPVTDRLEKKSTTMDSLREENFKLEKTTAEPTVIAEEQNPPVMEPEKSPEEKPSTANEPVFAVIEEPIDQPAAERSVRKMALSVMAAPAYNGVNNLNNGSIGNDFGLLVSFEIARNWSISTGGIYAKKLYDTGFRDYNPKNNIWTEYYPRTVNADCRVLDIPLNLSYTFIRGKNRTVSVGSGISSYIMLREDYQFTYARTNTDNPLSYQVVNENQHWLSVLNFQATIEQRLNKRLSISLQPYMKLPLGDIGFAGVKLQSLGMAANLNWNFNL